jgi:hypothetical protein
MVVIRNRFLFLNSLSERKEGLTRKEGGFAAITSFCTNIIQNTGLMNLWYEFGLGSLGCFVLILICVV